MTDVAIRVSGLSKSYRLGTAPMSPYFSDQIVRAATAPWRLLRGRKGMDTDRTSQRFWALRDLSFEVQPGEVLGVIGRNGAGKSTLLKILSRITAPETGEVDLHGRVGSLLEVGTGFHPELTGRENVYLNGAILGMKRSEISERFDDIVAFAEIDQFIDTPVKFYSSGMYMRLAFSVAAHLETELLLVDEVLAVGDSGFQRKCLGKMGEVASQGRTVLLVSHQLNQIRRLCTSCLWLEHGTVRGLGRADDIVGRYEAAAASGAGSDTPRSTREQLQFQSWRLLDTPDEDQHSLNHFSTVKVAVRVAVPHPLPDALLGISLRNSDHLLIWSAAARQVELKGPMALIEFQLPQLPIRPGPYWWTMTVHHEGQLLDRWDALPPLNVTAEPRDHFNDAWQGLLNYPLETVISTH